MSDRLHDSLDARPDVPGADLRAVFEAEVRARTRELAKQKTFAESIIQNVPAGVAYLDKDLVFRVANPMYAAFLRLAPEAIVGRFLFDVVPGGEGQIEALLRGVLATGKPYYATGFSFVYLGPDGQDRQTWWDFVYYPTSEAPGAPVDGVLVLANEVSDRVEQDRERERLQRERIEALEQADRLKDQFLAILSHELRTPLNAIHGFGSILEDGVAGELSPDQAALAGKILASADHLLGLVDDLLDLSRVQAGRFQIARRPIDPAGPIREAIAAHLPAARQKRQALHDALPDGLPPVLADARRLAQVVANLVGNAVKYTPDGGTVTVRARTEGPMLRVEVVDDGIGIAADQHERVFQTFTQVDMTSTRPNGGVGLGLSIVKALVESHGGAVGVASAPGAGATFWFTLPLAQGQA